MNKLLVLGILWMTISIISLGTIALYTNNDYQEMKVKYNKLSEWEQGAYGRVTWVQDADEANAAKLIERMSLENLPHSPKGSQYLVCQSKNRKNIKGEENGR